MRFEGCRIRDLADSFVQHKRDQGYEYSEKTASIYYRLAEFLEERRDPEGPMASKEAVMEWVDSGGSDHPVSAARRAGAVRAFCSFLVKKGFADCFVLPAELTPSQASDFVPYIFTRAEIGAVAERVDRIESCNTSPYRDVTYRALFRILYGCGLRLGEARRLMLGDLDLENGFLYVRQSKNGDSRLVPMDESLTRHLRRYLECGQPDADDPHRYLFQSPRGGCYEYSVIRRTLRRCFDEAGVRTRDGGVPRIHDLRHTFAVHSLMNAAERGESAYSFLPTLATYMGHKHIACTEYYLHLTAEVQDAMIDKMIAAYGDTIYKEA